MNNEPAKVPSLYNVFYSTPPKSGRAYKANSVTSVVAYSLLKAAAFIEKQIPECTVWNVAHAGKVHFVDQEVIDVTVLNLKPKY